MCGELESAFVWEQDTEGVWGSWRVRLCGSRTLRVCGELESAFVWEQDTEGVWGAGECVCVGAGH